MVAGSCRTVLHEVGACIVPTSSVDSSGFVPMKSKLRHRTVRDSDCSPNNSCCPGLAAVSCIIYYWLVYDGGWNDKFRK